ncbi:MAG: hypothetical protein QG658_559 [Patescibacteria group bacterium]|jgi:hypothetical protein|nr:hypothetical protein [Patescibacteria group bacterium]
MIGVLLGRALTYLDKIGRVVRQSPGGFFKLQASFEKLIV